MGMAHIFGFLLVVVACVEGVVAVHQLDAGIIVKAHRKLASVTKQPNPLPGSAGSAPGQSGTTPGQSGATPGQGGTAPPGTSNSTPGQIGGTPGKVCATAPLLPANSVISNGSCTSAPDGSSCPIVCQQGYLGTINATCTSGNWTVTGTCQQGCAAGPTVPPNSAITSGDCTNELDGSSCAIACQQGYIGTVTATCTSSNWDVTGTCQQGCAAGPAVPPNSAISDGDCTNELDGSSCAIACQQGYIGTVTATCTSSNWDVTGTCQPGCASAPSSVQLSSAHVTSTADCTNTPQGGSCAVTCDQGYIGNVTATCGSGGWGLQGSCCQLASGLNWKLYTQDINYGPMVSYHTFCGYVNNCYFDINNPLAFDSSTPVANGTGVTDLTNTETFNQNLPSSQQGFAVTTYGYFIPDISGVWTFKLFADNMVDVYLGDNPQMWTAYYWESDAAKVYTMTLTAGQAYNFRLWWGQSIYGYGYSVSVIPPGQDATGAGSTDGSKYLFHLVDAQCV